MYVTRNAASSGWVLKVHDPAPVPATHSPSHPDLHSCRPPCLECRSRVRDNSFTSGDRGGRDIATPRAFHTLINCQRAAGARCLTIHRAVGLWKRGKLCYSLARLIYVASQLALSNCSRLVSFITDASPALYAARPLAQWANADRSPQPFLPMTTPISPPLVCLVHTMRYMSGAMQFSRG